MPKNRKPATAKTSEGDYGVLMVKSLHACLKLNEFTADDLWNNALANGVPETEIARRIGALMKRYQSAGFYIRKTKRFKLSERHSHVLPIWATSRKMRKTN